MKPDEIRRFREVMRQMQRNLGLLSKSDAACCGITVAQCHALLEVGRSGEITLFNLASVLGLDTSTLSRTIEGMVRIGLVERKVNPRDRRYLSITLTERGEQVYVDINRTFDQFYADIFAVIPEDKHAQIFESLHLLSTAMDSNIDPNCREELINEQPAK